ncbi:MAG: hypothetical protein U9N61_04345, partial [Euryarchaeota archaeon]|nr:hypothetical protein [Euryarchaeota archaeon]
MQNLDFDGKPLDLVEAAHEQSKIHQNARNVKYQRHYNNYRAFLDMTYRNPDRSNVFIPKLYSLIESTVPRDIKALYGLRPYIPFMSKRPEFREVAQYQAEFLDDLLHKTDFLNDMILVHKLKALYGTSFIEAIPFQEMTTEKALVPEMVYGRQVGMRVQEQQVPRYRLRTRVYAPWEVFADPYATDLSSPEGCRYVIKYQITDRRQILRMAEKGMYPDLDIELLMSDRGAEGEQLADHWGMAMLQDMGLVYSDAGNDMGVIMRYESPERYIDCWNGRVILRDTPNPFKHGMINLTKFSHIIDPHTQNRFWGLGEAELTESLCEMLNDTWDLTFNSHNLINNPTIYYRKGSVNPDALVRVPANRVGIDASSDRPVRDSVYEEPGQGLPRDHYMIAQTIEDYIDLTSRKFEVGRGESTRGAETLGEVAYLKEAGDSNQELNVRLAETSLSDLAIKCVSHNDQFATPQDHTEVLGQQKAMVMQFANPQDLPGGFNFQFKGSDRVTNQMIKQKKII